jgi:hypothetical protein
MYSHNVEKYIDWIVNIILYSHIRQKESFLITNMKERVLKFMHAANANASTAHHCMIHLTRCA